ncbi:beta-ketoacyl synthase N-terminal-like domain-containing protein [Kutzneria albida]|uniref:Ketosynthase family 3 (KS3) domain-containing protein n=1 Tax=Kutzneria albida DSM 43870 TaxID=1449976 RepID=W5WB53_9PSEU|nr:beta-ketoacyl synthase N-terminal-like domain-containing protein [Kutzneria albida]AHH98383.1 hypothetical protein KALB_5021 [Kutzneria albida DSM 43870]
MKIAIVGLGCLLPGADNPEQFWANLVAGADLRTDGGPDQFGTSPEVPGGWGDAEHRITAVRGGFVRDPEQDPAVAGLGRVAQWPLYVARQALADAGITELDRTGIVLGNYAFPTEQSCKIAVPLLHGAVAEGLRRAGIPAGESQKSEVDKRNLRPFGLPVQVVGDALGLGGPRLALEAACSSALYSLALARDYLATGLAEVMIAGAVCAPDPLLIHLSFSDLHAYPANGISQPFDRRSTGIVTGQGAGVFVVKRLADAVRDGDRIHAVIESIGLSNDGAGRHLLAPNASGQVDTYRRAYAHSAPVDYIECHATGTPLGDAVELRGLTEFFGADLPLLGSVKGNLGHLLTVAGFTSMLKVILAMRHGVLPATPCVGEPITDRVLRAERPWHGPRRAGVSAFGFGGTNAHAVLAASASPQAEEQPVLLKLAVAGVGAKLCADDLGQAVRTATPALRSRPEGRWYGLPGPEHGPAGYLTDAEVDLAAYRIPPAEFAQLNPQHAVLFEAAETALTEAGYPPPAPGSRTEDLQPARVAVVVVMEMEPRTHTHRARFDIGAYVRAECARTGTHLGDEALDRLEAGVRGAVHEPLGANEVLSHIGNVVASRISASRNLTGPAFTIASADHALEVAGLLLLDPSVEAVLLGAVDLACGVENVLTSTAPGPLGDGAAAVVLTREGGVTIDAIASTAAEALARAGVRPEDVDYLEVGGELPVSAYQSEVDEPTCVVGSLFPIVGDTRLCGPLAALVKVVQCLRAAELPPTPAGLDLAGTTGTPWCRLEAPQPWLRRADRPRRVAAISCGASHLVLSADYVAAKPEPVGLILTLSGDTGAELAAAAAGAVSELDSGREPLALCRSATRGKRFTAVLVAASGARLREELVLAQRDLPEVIASAGEWSTPSGSYCTGRPLGSEGRVAFVYPGAFTSYPGAGRDLFRLFPELLTPELDTDRFKHAALYPRSRDGMDRRALLRHEAQLQEQIPVMLAAGTNFAVLHTRLLRDVLGVRPNGGFGYSLGESTMLFALGLWDDSARDDSDLVATRLFRDQLTGRKEMVRKAWGIADSVPDNEVWATHVLLTSADAVHTAAEDLDRVYLTHINTPTEVVVSGDPAQCRELISRIGCQAAKAPANHVMHCPIVGPALAELAELNTFPLTGKPVEAELLSTFDYERIEAADSAELAENIAWTLRSPIDFVRLVRTAHERGFRYFVEVGPGATCTRWITETLAGGEFAAVSVDRRGASTGTTLAPALARLISHGVPVDLRRLLGEPRPRRITHCVQVGGESLVDRVHRAASGLTPTGANSIASTLAQAHRAALRAHAAVQFEALDRLERRAIWEEADLLEFARGEVGKVFGPDYAVIDTYQSRVRLPEPPYLFVSRVTELRGRTGHFEPSAITTEYDLPHDAWYTVDGLVPCAVTIEAGQCDLLLISYLGIDFRNRGERFYRLLDSRLVFRGGLPRAGQTLRYEITIDRFVWSGDTMLFFFSYQCFADGELILELLDACAGFFTTAELENSVGVVPSAADRGRRAAMTRAWFTPLARTGRTELSAEDLALLAEGRLGEVFGPRWDQREDGCNSSIRLPGQMLRMIDEVTSIDRLGGPRGLGELSAVTKLDPQGWYFRCHFAGDPVLAGSLVAEGGVQLLQVYAMYLGMHLVLPDAEFQSVPGLETEVKVRGQITPATRRIRYQVEITGLSMLPRPTVIADIAVYDGERAVISMREFGVQVREKPGTPYRPGPGGVPPFLGRRNHRGEPALINELHLAHAAKGDLGTAMGPEFDVYRHRRAPYIPNGDFRFVDRIMLLDGVRGRLTTGARMHTEYDCPPEAWYFADNSAPELPNCVHMETSLQAAILLGYYLGATVDSPEQEYRIRNLDGQAELVKRIDLRGRTIRHESVLLSSQAVTGTVLQRFRYELSADGEVFYVGESLFGYFTEQALGNQVGLPGELPELTGARTLPVRSEDRWFSPDSKTGLRLADGHLRLVDEVDLVEDGGLHGKGYLRGRRRISRADWYFDCHFHRDPVMPGSLGVEAVIQGLQVLIIETGLAEGFDNAVFAVPRGVPMSWKYRGQILPTDELMVFDLHVREVRTEPDRLLVVADANVWRGDGPRIYELTDVAVEVRR